MDELVPPRLSYWESDGTPGAVAGCGAAGALRRASGGVRGGGGGVRQVSMRLDAAAYRDLEEAAKLLGGTPGQVARMLVRAGARRVLEGYDRYE